MIGAVLDFYENAFGIESCYLLGIWCGAVTAEYLLLGFCKYSNDDEREEQEEQSNTDLSFITAIEMLPFVLFSVGYILCISFYLNYNCGSPRQYHHTITCIMAWFSGAVFGCFM